MAKAKSDKVANAVAAALDAATIAVPIERGPVPVPLQRAGALWLLPWICEPECRVAFRLTVPKARKPTVIHVTWEDTRYALRMLREISAALATIETGTLEMLAASSAEVNAALAGDDDEDDEDQERGREADAAIKRRRHAAARFRLMGPVERGTWQITNAYPAVTVEDLGRALEILDLVDGTSTHWAHDASEAQTIGELAARSSGFARTNPAQVTANALRVEGADITVLDDKRPYLALIVFRHRLGDGPWDVRTHQQWDEQWLADYVESLRVMNERAAKLSEKYYAPRLETLLETPTTAYYETDFARILFSTETPNVTPLLWKRIPGLHHLAETTFAQAIDLVDRQFVEAGYRHLGDFQNGRSNRCEAYRVYGGRTDGSFALWGIVAGSFAMHWFFYALVGDDLWVTTSTFTLPEGARRPPRLSQRKVEKVSIVDQAAEHAKHVGEHAAQGATHASPGTLAEFLPIIDRFNAALAR